MIKLVDLLLENYPKGQYIPLDDKEKEQAQKDLFDNREALLPGAYMTQLRKLRKWEKQKKNEQYLRRRYPIVEEAYQKLQFAKKLCS